MSETSPAGAAAGRDGPAVTEALEQEVAELLDLARVHLGMDVAFLGRFEGGRRTVEVASAEDDATVAALTGTSDVRERTYCELIADGSLAAVTTDTATDDRLTALAVTHELRIGSYLGVPVVRPDGTVWGTVCAYTHDDVPGLGDGDAGALRFVAGIVQQRLAAITEEAAERDDAAAAIDALLADGEPRMLGQAVVDLGDGSVVGVEALARFSSGPPDEVFRLAALGERSLDLELRAAAAALEAVDHLPASTWLSCNVSSHTAADTRFHELLTAVDAHRVVVEVTEHERHDDPGAVLAALTRLRELGARIAMDDVGAGWSGLERALRLKPEILKLDRALITGLHDEHDKQALVRAFVAFAESVDALVVAEGIEQDVERQELHALGVRLGQGWLLGRPTPLPLPDVAT